MAYNGDRMRKWNSRLTLPLNFWKNARVTQVGLSEGASEEYAYPHFAHWARRCVPTGIRTQVPCLCVKMELAPMRSIRLSPQSPNVSPTGLLVPELPTSELLLWVKTLKMLIKCKSLIDQILVLSERGFKITMIILFKRIKEKVDKRDEKMKTFNREFNLLKRI